MQLDLAGSGRVRGETTMLLLDDEFMTILHHRESRIIQANVMSL